MSDFEISDAFLSRLLVGESFKIPASTQAAADAIRQAAFDFVIAKTDEPVELNIIHVRNGFEVWIRKLTGGRPQIFGCSCGKTGTEQDLAHHQCRYTRKRDGIPDY